MGVRLDGVLRVHLDPLDHEPDVIGLPVAVEVWKDLKVDSLVVCIYSDTRGDSFSIPRGYEAGSEGMFRHLISL